MRNESQSARAARPAAGLLLALILLAFASPAQAGPPTHLHKAALDLVGATPDPGLAHPPQPFNHACGAAVDSKGDVYVASAANNAIDVFNPAHEYLTSIANANAPCGLAVDSKGQLYVSEKATGKVVRYVPNAYPFPGTPTYVGPTEIDASGAAKGIAVDRFDDRLYVAESNRISTYDSEGKLGIDEVQRVFTFEATGGTYTLEFKGKKSSPIVWDAEHPVVQKALEEVTTIGEGNVSVTQGPNAGNKRDHLVTFKGTLGHTDVELLKGDPSGLTGGANKLLIQDTCPGCTQGFSGHIGEGSLSGATGVAAYTYKGSSENPDRYVFAADASTDQVKVFSGSSVQSLKLRTEIAGPRVGEGFGFGAAGAYLAVDPGNRSATDKCDSIAEQACTAGHLLVYDDAHEAVDEFDASGEFLDQFTNEGEAFADAEPTAMAVDRSGGPSDGTIYVTSGSGMGAKLLAFGPLATPSRKPLKELSHVLASASAVATDSFGDVYVAAQNTIHVYDATGKEIEVGPEGKGIEDAEIPLQDLAVDSAGRVYVLEHGENIGKVAYYLPSAYPPMNGATYTKHQPPITTQADFPVKFLTAIAVNPANDHLFVNGGGVTHELDSAGPGHESKFIKCFDCAINPGPVESIAVDGARGKVYYGLNFSGISIADPEGKEVVARISGAGCPGGPLPPGANPFLAVDESNGHAVAFSSSMGAVLEYDATGACVGEFGQFTKESKPARTAIDNSCAIHDPPLTEATTPTCKQFDPAYGSVYVAFDDPAPNTFDLTAFSPLTYGEKPEAGTGIASTVGGGNATLNGTVDPSGFELTECKFEYLLDGAYEKNLEEEDAPFSGAASKSCAEELAAIGTGEDPVPVHAIVTSLDAEERYRFRLIAKNKYGESAGDPWLFGPPVPTPKSALPILYDEATLRAEVDPSGLATKYRFEYGTTEGYGQSTPIKDLEPADGKVAVQAALTGLEEGMTYHFRVVAENEVKAVSGLDRTFETLERRSESCANAEYRTGLSAHLPDCRAYELVTPAETNGLSPVAAGPGTAGAGFNNWLATPRGSAAGERLSYFTFGTLPGFDGNGRLDGYRAERGPGEHPAAGWKSELFAPSFEESGPGSGHLPAPRGVASDQLYSFWKIEPAETFPGTLPEGLYLRVPDGTANPKCTPEPHAQLDFELIGCGDLGTDLKVESRFASPGGVHVIFSSKEHLEAEAAPTGTEAIYDRAAGSSRAWVVSVKPDGSPFGAGESASYVASSEDGSAVVFKVGGTLYRGREGQSSEVAEGPNTFAGISEDGGRVFYAATSNGEAPASIYACDLQAGPCAGTGAHEPTQIAASSIFVNVSPDGSHVLFSSKEAFTGAESNEGGEVAVADKDNLYAWDAETETTRFVAVLDSQDFVSFGGNILMGLQRWTRAIGAGVGIGRAKSPTRSSPDGEVFVFQSHAQLSPYDNEGRGEIYRYDPGAEAKARLLCVSCDPSAASPSADALLQDTTNLVSGVLDQTLIANVTDDGQAVLFQSGDRLLPEDANGVKDVYEWKAKGAGNCTRDGGCLALISSGQGDTPSFLYGMSADGHDVFFRTREKLLEADVAGSPSIYDARAGGGIPEPVAEEDCQGDACQGQGSTPPALPSPVSTGSRDDNVSEKARPCPKGRHRVKGRCVKKHHKRKHHHRRAKHNRGAAK
jgi:hypothetical protein